ncbi:MAG: hypothetical protein K2N73_05335 [Lachnospiraceae bacterium]|nr:hypothetical protein [Lachnospiraceae bacterium]
MKKIFIKENSVNTKRAMAHKAVLTAVCLTCALSISACGKRSNTNQNKDPLTGVDQSQTNESGSSDGGSEGSSEDGSGAAAGDYSEFDAMIGDKNTDPNSIIDYINTNIAGAAISDVKNFFSGLLGFGSDIRDIDFTRLEDSRQYMPEDMIAFMELMRLEGDTPSMVMSDEENRRVINMTLSEMLERALLFEHHLAKYPNDTSSDAAARLYEEIATNAISGGYDKTEGIEHYYKGETNDVVDREALQYYQQFADANKDSNLGKIVAEYIQVLQSNDFKINDSMEEFYRGLHEKLDIKNISSTGSGTQNTNTEGTDNNGTNSSVSGTNGSNAADTNANGTENSGTNPSETDSSENNTAQNSRNAADTVIEGTVSK